MRIEYYWNDDEIQFEIDLINNKNEVKRKYFEPTKMWAEEFIEKIKVKIKEKFRKDISSYYVKEKENENY